MKRLIKSEPLQVQGEKSKVLSDEIEETILSLRPIVAADRCEIKERGKEIKEVSYQEEEKDLLSGSAQAVLDGKKKKCNRMVTVHTQTRREEGIKFGLTFETRWNVIQHRDKTLFSFADWIKSFFVSVWIRSLPLSLNLILHSLYVLYN